MCQIKYICWSHTEGNLSCFTEWQNKLWLSSLYSCKVYELYERHLLEPAHGPYPELSRVKTNVPLFLHKVSSAVCCAFALLIILNTHRHSSTWYSCSLPSVTHLLEANQLSLLPTLCSIYGVLCNRVDHIMFQYYFVSHSTLLFL